MVAGELGQRAAEVRESDEGGGESWGATGGIWVLEALELTTQHRIGSYLLRGVGVEGYPCREVKGRPGVRLTTEKRKGVIR